jgi:NADH-quinone oxidoreductase subunit A
MASTTIPVFIFAAASLGLAVGMIALGMMVGPRRQSVVKKMPYESGMDPVHDTRRRFDVRFHLVAIAFLILDVELLFIYPWAVASRQTAGVDAAVAQGLVSHRGLVFGGAMFFITLVIVGLVYEWRKGVLRWR